VLGYDGVELVLAHPPHIVGMAEGDGEGIAEVIATGSYPGGAGMAR
jgi:hypothetical protein